MSAVAYGELDLFYSVSATGVTKGAAKLSWPLLLHLTSSDGSNSFTNQLLPHENVIPEIDLPDRLLLSPKLEHFVGSLPSKVSRSADPADTSIAYIGQTCPRPNPTQT